MGSHDASSVGGSFESTVVSISKEEVVFEQENRHNIGIAFEGFDESQLELGLGLSLSVMGSKNHKQIPRILTAKDLPSSMVSNSLGANNVSAGTKRAASPTGVSQVMGWPSIRAYRMNNMANQTKSIATEENSSQFEESKVKDVIYGADGKGSSNYKDSMSLKSSLCVKVNVDGVAIERRVDLNAHSSYESLVALEEMFTNAATEKIKWRGAYFDA